MKVGFIRRFPTTPKLRKILNFRNTVSATILLAGLFVLLKPTYPPASAGEPITEIHLSVENLFSPVGQSESIKTPIIVIDEERRRQAQEAEAKKIAEERAKQATARKLTVNSSTSGSQYGTAKLLYRDTLYWNCVSFVKAKTGIYRTLGNGARGAIQGYEPQVGAIGAVVGRVHAVYIIAVNGDQVTFIESNYVRGWITERTLSTKYFLGYVYS